MTVVCYWAGVKSIPLSMSSLEVAQIQQRNCQRVVSYLVICYGYHRVRLVTHTAALLYRRSRERVREGGREREGWNERVRDGMSE